MTFQKSYPEHHRTIGALLRIPYQHLQQQVYEQLARTGHSEVRPAHSVVFRYILPEGSRITDLAEQAGITKQSMAALVDHLQQHNYLVMKADPHDGRAKRVILTPRGKAVQAQARKLSAQTEKQWASLLGTNKMKQLRQLLGELYDKLEAIE